MFPNVRLLIAALFSSVVALTCGFGVFAALRVNSDPLTRLSAGAAALQLVTNEATAAPASWGTPFGPGLHPREAQISGVAMAAPLVAPGREASEPPMTANAWTARTVRTDAPAHPVLVHLTQPAPVLAATISPAAAEAPASDPPASKASETALTIPPVPITKAAAPMPKLASSASAPAQLSAATATQGLVPVPDLKKTAPTEPTALAVPAAAAIELAARPPSPAAQPANVTGAVPDAAARDANLAKKLAREPGRRTPSKLVRKPIERRRTAKRRVVRKTAVPQVARIGDGTFSAPFFQTAPPAFQRPLEPTRRGGRKSAQNGAFSDPVTWPGGQ